MHQSSLASGLRERIFDSFLMNEDFHEFIDRLREENAHIEFEREESTINRIKYVITNNSICAKFKSYIESNLCVADKDAKKAQSLLSSGKELLSNKNYKEALELLTDAVLLAPVEDQPHGSDVLSEAYAHRALTLFELKEYDGCRSSIFYALKYGYNGKDSTLMVKKTLCDRALAEETSYQTRRKLNDLLNKGSMDGKNSEVVGAEKYVYLASSAEKGRHLKVDSDVSMGSIVLRERPFAVILEPQYYENFCHHCCSPLNYRLYPCKQCSAVLYCSEACATSSWKLYHAFECRYLNILHSTGRSRLGLRIILHRLYGDSVVKASEKKTGEVSLDGISSPLSERICMLSDHSTELDPVISVRQALVSAFYLYLMSHNSIKIDSDSYYKIGASILHHIQQISVNSIEIFYQPIISLPEPISKNCVDVRNSIIGRAIYTSLSFINHSCVPNLRLFYDGALLIAIANRNLKKDEEITITYGPLYRTASRKVRLQFLSSFYYFQCTCPACDIKINDKRTDGYLAADALICSFCRGMSIYVNDKVGWQCLECKAIQKDPESKIYFAKNMIEYGQTLSEYGAAHKYFRDASNILNRMCHKDHRLLYILNNQLLELYMKTRKYSEAQDKAEVCLRTSKSIFGQDSPEFACATLQMMRIRCNIYSSRESGDSRNFARRKKSAAKYVEEIDSTLQNAEKVIEHYSLLTGFTVVDAPITKCLKQIAALKELRASFIRQNRL